MKKLLFAALLLGNLLALQAQPRFLPKFVKQMLFNKDSSRHASFFILPAVASAPETGLELGASGLYSFYTDKQDKTTRVSQLFAYSTFTTKGQQRFSVLANYWTPQNKYHFTAGASYINFPFDFYGIGNATHQADKERVGQKRFKLDLSAQKRISSYLYAGLVAGGYNYSYQIPNTGKSFETELTPQDRNGGSGAYIGPTIVFDSRNNNTYTTHGVIINSYLNIMHGLYTDNHYQGSFWNTEYSQFFSLNKRLVLGLDVQEQSLLGSESPFYLLPALGNDEIMRGYYNGRYRDRNMIAGQTELRYRISDRIGIVGFAGTGTVFHNTFNISNLKPNYGGGLRYFFDTEKGLTMRMDYGIGEKRPGETRQSGLYLSLGEAF